MSNINQSEKQEQFSSFWPVLIVTIGFVVLTVYQLTLIFQERGNLQRQVASNAEIVNRALQTQAELQRIASELLNLAETDNDAKAIIAKYKISRSGPAVPETPAAAAPTSAPVK